MIPVDTSVWVDHLRRGDARLVALLESASVLMHPFLTCLRDLDHCTAPAARELDKLVFPDISRSNLDMLRDDSTQ